MEKLYFGGERGIVTKLESLAKHQPLELDILLFDHKKIISKNVTGLLVSLNYAFSKRRKELEQQWKKMPRAEDRLENLGWDVIWLGNKSMRTLKANQSLEAMLKDRVWSDELAEIFDFTPADLTHYHSFKIFITSFLNSQTEQGFKDYIWKEAKSRYEIEYGKYTDYVNGLKGTASASATFLRRMLAQERFKRENPVPPRLYIEEMIFGRNDTGSTEFQQINTEIAIYGKEIVILEETRKDGERIWYDGEMKITQHRYRQRKAELEAKLRKLHERNEYYARHLFDDKESNAAMTFINAVGRGRLNRELLHLRGEADLPKWNTPDGSYLRVTSLAQGRELIKQWVKWYNETYTEQIEIDKKSEDAKREKQRRDERLAENRVLKRQKNLNVLELNLLGFNFAQIHEQTGFPVRTVGDIVKKYNRAAELWDEGLTVEQIQEQTGMFLNTLYSFLEVHVGAEELEQHLQDSTRLELTAQQQEEEAAKTRILIREAEALSRERMQAAKKKQLSDIEQYHNKGLNPTDIARFVSVEAISRKGAARKIHRILLDAGITPHFDHELATPEEIAAYQQEKESQRKKPPRISF